MMRTLFDLEPLADAGLQLNDAQKRAITHAGGPLLVIAGAGTGKTRVITERIRHLLQSDPNLAGENILGLTFTDKAAGEMKARVVKTVGERAKDVTLKTFHAFCESLLKDTDPRSRMLDKVDHWILLRRNLSRLQLDRYRRLAEPGQFLNDFVEFFSRCQDELISCEDYQRYADKLAAQLEAERSQLDADTLAERQETVAREQDICRAYRASEELLREKSCSSTMPKTFSRSAIMIKPSTAFAALLSAASSFSWNALPAGAKARIPRSSASASLRTIAPPPTFCASRRR